VRDLVVEFGRDQRALRALDGVSFDLEDGQTLALLGESGSGKSVTAQAILGLLPRPAGRITGGSVHFDGLDLVTAGPRQLREIRGNQIGMVYQDPLSSLNPVHSVGRQIAEMLLLHRKVTRRQAKLRAVELMERVGIPDAPRRSSDYPHQFSGGMRQRIMIAMAVALSPRLLIADEPTTALDVTIQAQIMSLLADLQRDAGMALILISHDLGVVAANARDVAVMYAGRIIETGELRTVYENSAHPYTRGLLAALPGAHGADRLEPIPGAPPAPDAIPPGCPFHPRCAWVIDECRRSVPALLPVVSAADHSAACHRAAEGLTHA
jgi:oligopeptide transport system ATP-binding protein